MSTDHRLNILQSVAHFDMDAPLDPFELGLIGQGPPVVTQVDASPVIVKDIEEDRRTPIEKSLPIVSNTDYNSEYVHWTRCQALVALRGYVEGWSALEELILRPYLDKVTSENEGYRGDVRDKAFSLRMRQQSVEDFLKFIEFRLQEAANVPRPNNEEK